MIGLGAVFPHPHALPVQESLIKNINSLESKNNTLTTEATRNAETIQKLKVEKSAGVCVCVLRHSVHTAQLILRCIDSHSDSRTAPQLLSTTTPKD